jgi:hypothetical protein
VSGALKKLPGIGTYDVKEGAPDFSVAYDSKRVKPDDIVKALVAAGEKDAKVKS